METIKTIKMEEGTEEEYEATLRIPPRPWVLEDSKSRRYDKHLNVLDANGNVVFELDFDDVFQEEQVFIGEFICEAVNRLDH